METTFDNCNNADLNNPVQNLLQNANTEFKTDKSNEIFKTDNPFNDGLNNFVQIGDNNMHTTTTTKLDSTNIIDMQQGDLPECEQMYHFGEEGLDSKLTEKRTFDDMGPETSVDVPDDVIMNTESSEENLSKSSLSHSKDALPLSDNLNPFDVKNSLTDLDANEFQLQDDTKTCTTPSENLLDTPVDPASLDDAKQNLPVDSVHTNGIHSEHDHLAEDLLAEDHLAEDLLAEDLPAHDQLPIASESKDIINEENPLDDLDQDLQADGGFINDFVNDYKINQHGVNEASSGFEEYHFSHVQKGDIDEECNKPELEEEHHKSNELDFNSHVEVDDKFVEKDLEHEEVKGLEEVNDAFTEETIHDLKPTSPIMQDFIKETEQCEAARQEQVTPTELTVEKCDEEFDRLEQESPMQLEQTLLQVDRQTNNFDEQFLDESSFDQEQKKFSLDLEDIEKTHNKVSEDSTLPLDDEFCSQMKELEDTVPVNEKAVKNQIEEIRIGGFSVQDLLGVQEETGQSLEHMEENVGKIVDNVQMEFELQKEELKGLQEGITEVDQELLTGITEEVKEMLIGDEIEAAEEVEKAAQCFQQPASLEMDTKPAIPSTEEICQPTAPESCDDSEDEWKYMQLKGEGEKEVPNSCETEELVSPVEQQKDIIPEELQEIPIQDSLPAAELETSQEAPVAPANESKDTASIQFVDPSDSELEITGSHLNPEEDEEDLPDMTSQLNPEAKEFVPTNMSPVHSDLSNGIAPVAAARHIPSDDVVAQSPRKGLFSMDDVQVPSQVEFNTEIAHCPSEVQTSPEQNDLYQEMNLKEAMHGSEKEEQVCEDSFAYNTDLDNVGMKDSIYIENSFGKEVDVMNTIQPVPADDEICNLSKEIPNESIAETTGTSSFLLETSANILEEKSLSPSPHDLVAEITQQVEQIGIFETPTQTVQEPEIVKLETTPEESMPPTKDIQRDIPSPVEQVETLEVTPPIESKPVDEVPPVVSTEDPPVVPTEVVEPVNPTKPEKIKLMDVFEVEEIETIKEEVVSPVELVPVLAPTQPTEIKKEKDTIEKVITEKIETVKMPAKVPETKKEVKARVPSATGPKKVGSSTSTASADATKPKTAQSATKSKTSTTSTAAPRPRTVPMASKPLTERKVATSTAAPKPKVDPKPTSSLTATKKSASAVPKTKPDEQTKVGVKQAGSKTGVTTRPPVTSRTSSTTSTASKSRTSATASTTGVTATKSTTQRVALSATAKSASTTKTPTSPRSTLTSTLRKTEAIKSPTGPARLSATKTTTTTTTAKTSSTTKSKPPTPAGKVSSTTTTTTTTSSATKKLPLTSTTRTSLKKSPAPAPKKMSEKTPVKRPVPVENNIKQANEIKLNGTTIEAVALDNKTVDLIQ